MSNARCADIAYEADWYVAQDMKTMRGTGNEDCDIDPTTHLRRQLFNQYLQSMGEWIATLLVKYDVLEGQAPNYYSVMTRWMEMAEDGTRSAIIDTTKQQTAVH